MAAGTAAVSGYSKELDVLRRHCDREGRDYATIEKTCMAAFDTDPAGGKTSELVGRLRWLAGMGIETVIGSVCGTDPVATIKHLGREVVPAVAEL